MQAMPSDKCVQLQLQANRSALMLKPKQTMLHQPRLFARQLNPGVILTQELKMKMFNYEALNNEKAELETEIDQIRKQQDIIEDKLAEALAEEEFQHCLRGQILTPPNEADMLSIFKKNLGPTIDKLSKTCERKLYLDIDMQKLKMNIEKEIVKVNAEAAAADAASN